MNIRPLPVAQLDASFAEKFWARTITRDSGCVEWTGPVAAQSRAMVFVAGAQYYASRVAFFLSTGTDPGADLVCHRCDNGLCVRRGHLFLGSQADNMADMRAKGRERHRQLAGEAHPNAKGSNDDIRAVRELYATGEFTQSQLAEQFGVSQKTIGNWARGAGRVDADGPTLAVGRDLPREELPAPVACTQCGQVYQRCRGCGERIIFVPKQGFGNSGEWRHLEPPVNNVGHHLPHPELVIT